MRERKTPSTVRRLVPLFAACVLATGLSAQQVRLKPDATAVSVAEGWSRAAQRQGLATVDRPLPALSLSDLTGDARPLRQRSDEVTVINFWATWCVPCLKELPELVKLSHEWQGHGVQVVGIAIDSGKPANIRAFTARHGMDYLVLLATQRWARDHFDVFGLPVSIVVDREGRIRHRLTGPQTGSTFAAAVRPYL